MTGDKGMHHMPKEWVMGQQNGHGPRKYDMGQRNAPCVNGNVAWDSEMDHGPKEWVMS